MDNRALANTVFSIAALLEVQGANPYRIAAYRRAAMSFLLLPRPAGAYLDPQGELSLPWLGPSLRRKLGELVRRERMRFHDELVRSVPRPQRDLLAVPGVGPKTANRLVNELGIRGVRGLAKAARQGQLRKLRGFGETRERRLGEAAERLLAAAA